MGRGRSPPPALTGAANRSARRWVRGRMERAVERRLGDAQRPGDVGDRVRLIGVELAQELALLGREARRASPVAAARSSCGESRLRALADQIPLELGEG